MNNKKGDDKMNEKYYCKICNKEFTSFTERTWRTGEIKWVVPTEGIIPKRYSVDNICSSCMLKIHKKIIKAIQKKEEKLNDLGR